jgi:Zn2+/Cd2+-exporting ATPase
MIPQFVGGLKQPARRRMWLTIGSGTLIVLAFVTGLGLRSDAAWAGFMTAAALLAGSDIAVRAWHGLRVRHLGIELLVTVAATGALIIGEYWEAAAVTFLFILGAWLEMLTMRHTRGALKELLNAAPAMATVLREGLPVEVAASEVRLEETVLVKAGQRVPVDGEVIEGAAAVNEATITGEPIPAEKAVGSRVHAGTLAENGLLHIRAKGVGPDTTLARIVHRVEEAQEEKAPTQRMIERFARWYTPSIFFLAAGAFVLSDDIRLALTLLVVGCPGALVISTPVSIVAGIGRAARNGILIKGGQHLESAGRITALALDKTGTLTEGRPRLAEIVALSREDQDDVLRWAAIAEGGSDHPLGRPIVKAALRNGPLPTPDHVEEVAGTGITARYEGRQIAVGSRRLLDRLGISLDAEAEQALARLLERGYTPVLVARDGRVVGILGLTDTPRPGAAAMIERLRRNGVGRVVMLTGDQPQAAQAIAAAVGLDEAHAGLLPEQKLEHIRRLRAEGFHVAMVGDGINDAPALATADTSIAMGAAGSDVAIEIADIALMTDDLGKINEAIEVSRATLRNMRQNLVIALLTVVGLLAGVFAGYVHMAAGMLIHQLSVLIVISNGMRLLRTPPLALGQPGTGNGWINRRANKVLRSSGRRPVATALE